MHTLKLNQWVYEQILLDHLHSAWEAQNFLMYGDAMRSIFARILRQGMDALTRPAMRPLGVPQSGEPENG